MIVWFFYFSAGVFIKEYSFIFEWILRNAVLLCVGGILLEIVLLLYGFINERNFGYYSQLDTLNILSWICILVASAIRVKHKTFMIWIGKNSFLIYLIHMPLSGMINALSNMEKFAFITPFRPIIVLAVVSSAIKCNEVFFDYMEKKYNSSSNNS